MNASVILFPVIGPCCLRVGLSRWPCSGGSPPSGTRCFTTGNFITFPNASPAARLRSLFTKAFREQSAGQQHRHRRAARARQRRPARRRQDVHRGDVSPPPADSDRPLPGEERSGKRGLEKGREPKRHRAPAAAASGPKIEPVVTSIRTFSDKEFGQLLISDDQKATLVLLELTTDFTERKNEPTIAKIEKLDRQAGASRRAAARKGVPDRPRSVAERNRDGRPRHARRRDARALTPPKRRRSSS